MNYLKAYCNLIRKAENRDCPEGYVEKHHIFPKSIFGNNDRVVALTAREHYIAHALLEKIYINRYGIDDDRTKKMIYAFWCMNNQKTKNNYLNSVLYEVYKKKFGRIHSALMNGRKHSQETKNKMSESAKGKNKSDSHKKNLSVSRKGHKQTPETINKRTLKTRGKKRTEEQRLLISQSQKGKKLSQKTIEKRTNSFCKYMYEFTSPNGIIIITNNARKFCRNNNLHHTAVYKVCDGLQKHHKGWKIVKKPRTDKDK